MSGGLGINESKLHDFCMGLEEKYIKYLKDGILSTFTNISRGIQIKKINVPDGWDHLQNIIPKATSKI